jgi:CPA1 family monovalent cation:H+ antiporter
LLERLENEDADAKRTSALDSEIEFLLLARERDKINDLYRAGNLKDDPRRRIERELDLRDAQLTNLRADE